MSHKLKAIPGVPFSIACVECDAGQEIGSLEAALTAGWEDIEIDLDGLGWNYIGDCPDCKDTEKP